MGERKQVELLSHQLEMGAVANAPAQHKHIRVYMYGRVNDDPACSCVSVTQYLRSISFYGSMIL